MTFENLLINWIGQSDKRTKRQLTNCILHSPVHRVMVSVSSRVLTWVVHSTDDNPAKVVTYQTDMFFEYTGDQRLTIMLTGDTIDEIKDVLWMDIL